MLLALVVPAPLEEAANPEVTPNPAKAPWYFLGLQELVGYSALVGGVLIPGIEFTPLKIKHNRGSRPTPWGGAVRLGECLIFLETL